jgi:isopentenyldiphosphate isomerase
VEVLDRDKRLLAVMPLSEVRRQGLAHRAVQVLVFDPARRLLLIRRSRSRASFPGKWDVSAAGPVNPGESRRDAAVRVLEATMGLRADKLRLVAEIEAGPESGHEHVSLYATVRQTPGSGLNPDLASEAYPYAPEELAHLLEHFRDLLTPRLITLWERGLAAPPRPEG